LICNIKKKEAEKQVFRKIISKKICWKLFCFGRYYDC